MVLASIMCEDLAQIDEVADVMRSVGPTIVITPLLDGPQLSSRWAARYASVLADDPWSAVRPSPPTAWLDVPNPTGINRRPLLPCGEIRFGVPARFRSNSAPRGCS